MRRREFLYRFHRFLQAKMPGRGTVVEMLRIAESFERDFRMLVTLRTATSATPEAESGCGPGHGTQ
jgi:hypothetical protein